RSADTGRVRPWVWPAAAAVLGGVAAEWPLAAGVLLGGGIMVVLALVAPRTTAGLTVLAVLFVRVLEHLTGVEQVGYLDEAMIALCVVTLPLRRLLTRTPLRTLPGQWWFAGFGVCGVLGALVLHVPFDIFLLGAFVTLKGPLFAFAVAQLDWTPRHVAVAVRVAAVVLVVGLLAAVANLVAPGPWEAVLVDDKNAAEARGFLPSIVGPFTHPIDMGQFTALAFVAVAAWRSVVGRSAFTLALLIGTALGALGTARRTAAGSVAAAWLWLQAKRRSTGVFVAILAGLPVAVVVLAAPLTTVVSTTYQDYFGNGHPEARTVLTIDSFKVATSHFPLGAGFGRFGSAIAATNYSPEYVELGYPYVWGLGRNKEDGRFLTDTEWPALIGETGFFGALAFALGLAAVYRAALRRWRTDDRPLARWAGLTCAGWVVACLVQSVATVTFTGPPAFALLFGLAGVVAALGDRPRPAGADAAAARDAAGADEAPGDRAVAR
ncbi:MAG TPA: hypothetical protein VF667_08755, partial [Pseudonocardia sp.]